MSTAIIGAGIAGLACATRLGGAAAGVQLFDKARGPGGRMSTRRVELLGTTVGFDHGAQYFTVRDPGFAAQVARWAEAGVAAPWPAAGPDAWVGTPGMNAPVRALAAAQHVSWSARVTGIAADAGGHRLTVEGRDESPRFERIVLALPAEQAALLLAPIAPALAELAAGVVSEPCWTVMAAFAEPLPLPTTIRAAGAIGWAARDGAKPGRAGGETWVIQGSPDWSCAHLEAEGEVVATQLLAALATSAGRPLPPPLHVATHRWRYARSGDAGAGAVWDAERRIGLCGDWLLGPRVEAAWCSGALLAEQILESPR
jgi:renalase